MGMYVDNWRRVYEGTALNRAAKEWLVISGLGDDPTASIVAIACLTVTHAQSPCGVDTHSETYHSQPACRAVVAPKCAVPHDATFRGHAGCGNTGY